MAGGLAAVERARRERVQLAAIRSAAMLCAQ